MKRLIGIILPAIMVLSVFAAIPLSADAYLDYEFAESGCIGNYEERPEYA